MTFWNTYRGEWSWGKSLLLKSGILGLGIFVVLWAGWPQPQNGSLDHSSSPIVLSDAKVHQEVQEAISPVLSFTKEEPLKALAEESKEVSVQATRVALLVDLNESSHRELEALPGIGVVLADRIVAYRSTHGAFQQINELVNVSGIGKKRLRLLAPLVKIEERKS